MLSGRDATQERSRDLLVSDPRKKGVGGSEDKTVCGGKKRERKYR